MQLVIQSGPGAGKQFNLGGKPLILGRDPEIEISIPDATLAHRHARFENVGGIIYVTDLESGSGTFLNGQRMSPAARYPLRPDDTLRIGATTFQIQAQASTPAESPAASATSSYNNNLPSYPSYYPVAASEPLSGPVSGLTGQTTTTTGTVKPAGRPGEDQPGAAAPAPAATPLLQPYQYQIATSPLPATPEKPAAPLEKARRKANWPSILAALLGVALLIFGVVYFLSANKPDTIEIRNPGQATRTSPKFSPAPLLTPTADTSGATYKGPTPGIGASSQGSPIQVSENDLPVYPAARRIDNPTGAVYFTEYITGDGFDKVSDWAKSAFSDKGWGNIEVKSLPGKEGAILTGQKANLSAVVYLLGPGQKDTPPYGNFFKSANVEPSGSLIVINITAT